MDANAQLKAYLYPGLIILHWTPDRRLETPIEIHCDGALLEKPYIGAEFAGQMAYFLAASLPPGQDRQFRRVALFDPSGTLLTSLPLEAADRIPRGWVNDLALANRIRLRRALLDHLPQKIPHLPPKTHHLLQEDLSETELTYIAGPRGLGYFRTESMGSGAPSEIGVRQAFYREAPGEVSEALSAWIYEDEAGLHGVLEGLPERPIHRGILGLTLENGQHLTVSLVEQNQPETFDDPQDWLRQIQSIQPQSSERLAIIARKALRPKPIGWLDGLQNGWLKGWAERVDDPTRIVELRPILEGEDDLAPVYADLPYRGRDGQSRPSGFAFPLPEVCLDGQRRLIRLIDTETGCELNFSPYQLGADAFDGEFELSEEGTLKGWVRPRALFDPLSTPPWIHILIDGERQPTPVPAQTQQSEDKWFFESTLPDRVFDTQRHRLEVLVQTPKTDLPPFRLERSMLVEATYRGQLDALHPSEISGWIVNTVAPQRSVPLEVLINGEVRASGLSCLPRSIPGEPRGIGFKFQIEPYLESGHGNYRVELRLARTNVAPLGGAQVMTPLETAILSLTQINQWLKDAENRSLSGLGLGYVDDPHFWAREAVIVPVIEALRSRGTLNTRFSLQLSDLHRLPDPLGIDPVVSVLIPVYKGKETTIRCVLSVLESFCETPYELTVVNDGSPDQELVRELESLSIQKGFDFVSQPRNLGFTATVNRHFKAAGRRDVVLLNSDTQVAPGWLDRLRAAAQKAPNIGTVTPLSNNATLMSFPVPFEENELPEGLDVAKMDALCAKANPGVLADIPTGVGFCLYIRRALLDDIGVFDERRWGRGYGEENDLCLRASHKGWRNVGAYDVFVFHEGSVSFGKEKWAIILKNQAVLDSLYPDYSPLIQRYRLQDPQREARNRLARELLKNRASRHMLFIAHTWGGGTERALRDLAALLKTEGEAVLVLRAISPDRWVLESLIDGVSLHYEGKALLESTMVDLKALGVWHIHYHQTLGFDEEIWSLPGLLGVDYDVTIHDFLAICPRVSMMNGPANYCGSLQFDSAACGRCIRINGLDPALEKAYQRQGASIEQWRSFHLKKLENARTVFIPSQAAAAIYEGHVTTINHRVIEHPSFMGKQPPISDDALFPLYIPGKTPVLILGAIGEVKGFHLLKACVHDASLRGLPLHYDLLGFTQDDGSLEGYDAITIRGAYEPERAVEKIRETGCRVALFLSPAPETWSYTLSEVYEAGLYPVGLDIGAIGQRIRQSGKGRVLPLHSTAAMINDCLMEVIEEDLTWMPLPAADFKGRTILADYYGL